MSGGEVENYFRDGHIREIAEYCENDVLNTYRVWLRYELFRGRLSEAEFQASEANLVEFIRHEEARSAACLTEAIFYFQGRNDFVRCEDAARVNGLLGRDDWDEDSAADLTTAA
jgi:hypothetical protein